MGGRFTLLNRAPMAVVFVLVISQFHPLPYPGETGDPTGSRPMAVAVSDAGLPVSITSTSVRALPSALAFGFIENKGQVADPDVRFTARAGGLDIAIRDSAIEMWIPRGATTSSPTEETTRSRVDKLDISDLPPEGRGPALRMSFAGSNRVVPVGGAATGPFTHFMLGDDPSAWASDAQSFQEVSFPALYSGIDLVLSLRAGGIKYEFVLDAWTDPSAVKVTVGRESTIRLLPDGSLSIETSTANIVDGTPVAWQPSGPVDCNYVLKGPGAYGFECPARNPAEPLTIDPLVYSSFVGGVDRDLIVASALDDAGNAYFIGSTESANFLSTFSSNNTTPAGGFDVFVIKLDASGTPEYVALIGGIENDSPTSVEVNPAGEVIAAGTTWSADFPTTSGVWRNTPLANVTTDGFVFRLNASGASFVFSTFLGGLHNNVQGASLAPDGSIVLAGSSRSPVFPTTPGAFQTVFDNGSSIGEDAFVMRLSAGGNALLFSTFVGGSSQDVGRAVDVDGANNAWLVGYTNSMDFPLTAGANQSTKAGFAEAFLVKLNESAGALLYSSYLGGSQDDFAYGVAVEPGGDAVVLGFTASKDFPTTPDSFQPQPGRPAGQSTTDVFVTRVDGSTGEFRYSSYLGGLLMEWPYGIATDRDSAVYVVGSTMGLAYPTTPDAYQTEYAGGLHDGFLAKVNPAGTALAYSTFLGGTETDDAFDVSVNGRGDVLVVGFTNSTDFPTTPGAFDPATSSSDGFVTRIDLPHPTLLVSAPDNGTNTSIPSVWVSGLTDAGVNLTVGGVRAAVSDNGSFGLAIALVPGANVIEITAVASDGRSNSLIVVVTFIDPVQGLLAEIASQLAQINATAALLDQTRAALANAETALNVTREELGAALDQLNATRTRLAIAEANLSRMLDLIGAIEDDLADLQAEGLEHETKANATRFELADTQANLTKAFELVGVLMDELAEARSFANGTAAAYLQLSERLDAAEAAQGAAGEELSQMNDVLNETRRELDETGAELGAARATLTMALVALLAVGVAVVVVAWRSRRPPGQIADPPAY